MRFEWDNTESIIGYYELTFLDDENQKICSLSLRDLRNKDLHSSAFVGVKFNLHCAYDGKIYRKTWTNEVLLEDVKKECESFIFQIINDALTDAVKKVENLTPQVEWLKNYRKEKDEDE